MKHTSNPEALESLIIIFLLGWNSRIMKQASHQVYCRISHLINTKQGASLVAQWLRILLPTWGTWVQALVREDPTCRGATKPACHNY